MTSRRARERANARPWEAGEEPDRHAGDFPEYEDDEQHERCPNTGDLFGDVPDEMDEAARLG